MRFDPIVIWRWEEAKHRAQGCRHFEYLAGVKGWFVMVVYYPWPPHADQQKAQGS